jgi:hypothetical protein
MAYTLTEAAKATGLNKSTIFRAIQKGTISAGRDATTGQWTVEPAELHRAYPPVDAAVAGNDAVEPIAPPRNDTGDAELREVRAKMVAAEQRCVDAQKTIASAEETIADLRRRLDAADAERRQTAERLTALLTDARAPVRRTWWRLGQRL